VTAGQAGSGLRLSGEPEMWGFPNFCWSGEGAGELLRLGNRLRQRGCWLYAAVGSDLALPPPRPEEGAKPGGRFAGRGEGGWGPATLPSGLRASSPGRLSRRCLFISVSSFPPSPRRCPPAVPCATAPSLSSPAAAWAARGSLTCPGKRGR